MISQAADHLQGGAGNDYVLDYDYYDNGRDTLEGGEGNDLLLSGGGGDIVDGGEGTDTLYYSTSREGVQVTLGEAGETTVGVGGTADGDQISNIENVLASRYDDSVTGNSENNTIYGYIGDDVIDGGAGNDTLYGGLWLQFLLRRQRYHHRWRRRRYHRRRCWKRFVHLRCRRWRRCDFVAAPVTIGPIQLLSMTAPKAPHSGTMARTGRPI